MSYRHRHNGDPGSGAAAGPPPGAARARLLELGAALAIAAALFAAGAPSITERTPVSDELFYLRYAWSIAQHGVFGVHADHRVAPAPGADIAPGYAALIALALRFDPEFAAATDCVLDARGGDIGACPHGFRAPRLLQLALNGLGLGLLAVWLRTLLGSAPLALFTVLLVAASGAPVYFSDHFLTESVYPPFAFLFLAAFALAVRHPSLRWSVVCALLLGVLALIRPTFYYLFALLLPMFVVMLRAGGVAWQRSAGLVAVFALVFFFCVGGWLARNAVQLDRATITTGYGARALSTRLAYNAMTPREYLAGWIYWLPDFGDKLAPALFGRDSVALLDLGNPKGYYLGHRAQLRREAAAATGFDLNAYADVEGDPALDWLIRHKLLGEPAKHAAVSLLLAWRGLFVEKYFGLAGAFALLAVFAGAADPRARRALCAVFAPALLLLLFNAAVSLNIPRYNLPLILPMALAMALVGQRAIRQFRPSPVAASAGP